VLAYHYTTALRLASAAGHAEQAAELEESARRFLVMAGDRALGLDVDRAEQQYQAALGLAPPGHPAHAEILTRWADAVRQSGRSREAAQALEAAIEVFRANGDLRAAARTMGMLSSVLLTLADARQEAVGAEAVSLLESEPPGPELVAAYARLAGVKLVIGDLRATIEWADRAKTLASGLGLEVPANAMGFGGYARSTLGDPSGLEEMRAALALAIERGEGRDAAVLYNNLGVALWPIEGPAAVLDTYREGIEFAERRGIKEIALGMRAASMDQVFEVGEWDRVIELAGPVVEEAEERGDGAALLQARCSVARVKGSRGSGDLGEMAELAQWLVDAARASAAVEDLIGAITGAARLALVLGERERARSLLAELEAELHVRESPMYAGYVSEMVRASIDVDDRVLAERLAQGLEPVFPMHAHAARSVSAILAEGGGDHGEAIVRYAEAAEGWGSAGCVWERALALLGQGRCLVATGRTQDAAEPLRRARDVFVFLRAAPALAEADELLVRTIALSS